MTHFIKKLIQTPFLEDPAKNHKDIHRHYYRYSKGDFIGPALKKAERRFADKGLGDLGFYLAVLIRSAEQRESQPEIGMQYRVAGTQ